MAVSFIFFIAIISFLLLVLSIVIQSYPLGAISTMGIIVIGVSILANGMMGINNVLTLGLGIIFVSVGLYIFLNGTLEKIREVM